MSEVTTTQTETKEEQKPLKKEKAPKKDKKAKKPRKPRKKIPTKKLIGMIIGLVILIVGGVFLYNLFFVEAAAVALTDTVSYGSLATTLEGTATTLPADSDTLTFPSDAEVKEVYVSAGDYVEVGDLLYVQDDSEVDDAIDIIEDEIDEYLDEIDDVEDTLEDLYEEEDELMDTLSEIYISAPFSGKVTNLDLEAGDKVQSDGYTFTMVDDSVMKVTQYFSYAYESSIAVGSSAKISIADQMMTLDGWVSDISKVSYVSSQGTQSFAVTISMNNPGSLTSDMMVNAYITLADGTKIYPVESAALEYANEKEVTSEITAEITAVYAEDYQYVTAGTTVITLDSDDVMEDLELTQSNIESNLEKVATYEEKIADLYEEIEETEEDRADYEVYAELAGRVIVVNADVSRDPMEGMTSVMIYDLTTMEISANIDELDIDLIEMGMPVSVSYSTASETVEYEAYISEISYEATNSSGVSYFPVTIVIESAGNLSAGVSVSYSISVGEEEEGALVPLDALKSLSGGTAVFIQGNGESDIEVADGIMPDGYYAKLIEVHSVNTMYALVLEGLEEGMVVFTRYEEAAPSGGDSTSDSGTEETTTGMMMPGDMGGMPGGMSGGMSSGGMSGGMGMR